MNREVKPKYTLRKLSVGLTSIMIGSTILLTSQQVHAADDSSVEENHQVISKIDNEVKTSVLANNSVADNKDVRATTNQTNNADSAIVTATDVEAKQKSDQTKTADPFTPAKPTDNPDADPETIPLVNQKVNDQPVKAQKGASFEAYITAKDKSTGQEYVSSYLGNDKAMSTINLDLVDPNSLEYHVIYHNGDETFNPNFYIGTYNGYSGHGSNMYVDESRINDQNKLIQTKSSGSHNVIFRVL